jgi:replicative DNA helicase
MSKVRQLFGGLQAKGTQTLDDLRAEMERHARESHRMRVGFPTFERMTHLSGGNFVLLGGRPGAYKTTLALSWAANLALSGRQVVWADLDQQKHRLATALLSRLSKIPKNRITDHFSGDHRLTVDEERALQIALATFGNLSDRFFVLPQCTDIDSLFEGVRALPYDALFVDYLQLVEVPWARTDHEKIAFTTRVLGWLAKLPHRPLVVAVSQLNRGAEQREDGPSMADFAGSNRLEYEADVLASMIRNSKVGEGCVEMHILKNRDGPTGMIPMQAYGARSEMIETVADMPDPRD